jgi:hypothetical protein
METRAMHRTFVAVVLAASLANPTFEPFWTFLSSLWGGPAGAKEGFGWDPDGLNSPTPPPPQTKAGFGWDPNGLNSPTPPPPQTEEGFGWDPSGVNSPAP